MSQSCMQGDSISNREGTYKLKAIPQTQNTNKFIATCLNSISYDFTSFSCILISSVGFWAVFHLISLFLLYF